MLVQVRKRMSVSFQDREASLLERMALKRDVPIAIIVREAVKEYVDKRWRTAK